MSAPVAAGPSPAVTPGGVRLERLRAGRADETLFLVPGLEADPTELTGLVAAFTGPQEVYAVAPLAHDGQHRPVTDIEQMAELMVGAIRAVQPTGPYHLLGFSFGGIAAHEMAVRLEEAGEVVAALVIMDTYPHEDEPARPAVPETDPDEWAARLRQENGALLGGMSDEELRRGVRVGRNNVAIRRTHRLGVFERDALLFVAEDSRERGSGGHLWEPHVRGKITEVYLPCTHPNMVEPDMLGQVWTAIDNWLR